MKVKLKVIAAIAALQLLVPTVFAQNPVYQITGRIVDFNAGMMVVRNAGQNWVILVNKDTRSYGPLRIGDVVTVNYKMIAMSTQIAVPLRAVPPRLR